MVSRTPGENLTDVPPQRRGFSLVEIIVVIGVIAVLVGVLIPTITQVIPAARETVYEANLEKLNQAVWKYNHAMGEFEQSGKTGEGKALAVGQKLQEAGSRNPESTNYSPGAPYLEPTLSLVETSNDSAYRAEWNGRMFLLLEPGTTGTGLDLADMMGGSASP